MPLKRIPHTAIAKRYRLAGEVAIVMLDKKKRKLAVAAQTLISKGVPTPSGDGVWLPSTVCRIMRSIPNFKKDVGCLTEYQKANFLGSEEMEPIVREHFQRRYQQEVLEVLHAS